MADFRDSHNHVFLKLLQMLSHHNHKDTQVIQVDGRSLDIPKVVAIARCGKTPSYLRAKLKKFQVWDTAHRQRRLAEGYS